eukprot:jgi/Ulvmu1/7248/UM035_0035.1
MVLSNRLGVPTIAALRCLTARTPGVLMTATQVDIPTSVGNRNIILPPQGQGPRVQHLRCLHDGRAAEALAIQLGVSQAAASGLMAFGAVYYSAVHPDPSQCKMSLTLDDTARLLNLHQQGILRHGADPKLQQPRRMFDPLDKVSDTGFFRIHWHPKRSPQAHAVRWRDRIVAEEAEFVVVSKPWGVQVTHRVDNVLESLVACVGRELDAEEELLPLHRLDSGTEGVCVLGKTKAFAKRFGRIMQSSSAVSQSGSALSGKKNFVCKIYLALVSKPVPVGILRHWAEVNARTPGSPPFTFILPTQGPGSHGGKVAECALEILEVTKVKLNAAAQHHWGVDHAFQHKIRLITGKTHQIRAQLAAVAEPLLGDHLYSSLLGSGVFQQHDLHSVHAAPRQAGNRVKPNSQHTQGDPSVQTDALTDLAHTDWIHAYRKGAQHERPLGLQAHELVIDQTTCMGPPPVVFTAGDPWWLATQT